ncbi:thiamine-phosphate kinase [Aliidiomarina minuta]|uniref:Thiamine-monophosphate kinase n=1 Tax=Aliidiomarina minuta TaxID=880057 RepID=A0A432W4I3_9GAMM|nr:thiamine-phosphate kinase [Aliidiomarina minuta]RUO24411.1 thiamine-phosphate kinase [Aliidiomarina minuta]
MTEFEVIASYFNAGQQSRGDVILGQSDDCAIVRTTPQTHIAVTTDTMVAGVHFDEKVPPRALGHKLVAVNLSDLAAMGAEPAWLSLAITMPEVNTSWLEEFSAGLHELANYYNCQLIGGDTTRGPLTLTLTAQGLLPEDQLLTRRGANPGDWIYVSGTLGDAAAALAAQRGEISVCPVQQQQLEERLFYPTPRITLGQALRPIATSAIDISDGLAADLSHILKRSEVGARLQVNNLPYSNALNGNIAVEQQRHFALHGGDDYELCFTIPEASRGTLETALAHIGVDVTCVGQIEANGGLRLFDGDNELPSSIVGYQHFGVNL